MEHIQFHQYHRDGKMMLNFLNNLLKVFEGAGFFFVPILCLMALFDLSQLRKNRGTRSYLLICAVMLFVYLIISESSRYLLIPLLLCGVLAGAGMGAPVKYLHWTGYFKFLKKWHLILLLTIVTICFSCLKLTLRDRSSVMRIFATELRNHPTGKFALCSVNCPQGAKLGSLLRFHPDFEFINCDNFDDAIDFLTVNNFVDKDIYFFTRIPRNYQVDDFKLWFRGKHSIFPFDIVQIKGERSYRYILMKFNGRTLDGTQTASRYGLLQQLPPTLRREPFLQWAKVDLQAYFTWDQPKYPGIFTSEQGIGIDEAIYLPHRQSIEDLPPARIELRNQLLWQEDYRVFDLSEEQILPEHKINFKAAAAQSVQTPAIDPPLLLTPDQVFIPDKWPTLSLTGAVPLWSPDTDRIAFSTQKPEFSIKDTQEGKICFTVTDRFLQQSSSGTIKICRGDPTRLPEMPLKILLIEDPFSHDTKLADNLPALLGKNSILQTINITAEQSKTPMQVTAKLPLPKGDFDFVLLNIFTGLATRMWLLPINIDPYFDQELSFMLRKLRTIYPNSCISLILPPLPSAERSMYPYCRSSWLGRLSFYNLNSSIQRFYRRHPQKNLEVVPLYLSIAPNDYWPHRLNGQRIRSGHTLTAQGQKKAAETIGAFLVYKSIEQKESDQ